MVRIVSLTSRVTAAVVLVGVLAAGPDSRAASAGSFPPSGSIAQCQERSEAGVVRAARPAGPVSGDHRVTAVWPASDPVTVTYPGEPRYPSTLVGTAVSLQMTASDSEDPAATFTFSATGLPPGLSISSSTGLISGTASTAGGYYPVTVTATDSADTSQAGQVTVAWYVYSTIVFTPPGPQAGAVGDPVELQPQVSGTVPGYAVRYLAANLPPGLSINCATGLISGWLWSRGSYHVTVSAQDNLGSTGSTTLTWTVALPADRGTSGHIRLPIGHMCLTDARNGSANGTPIQIWTCGRRSSQRWTIVQDQTIRIHGKCVSVAGQHVNVRGAKIVLAACTGSPAQRWLNDNGILANEASGEGSLRCLTDPRYSTRDGTELQMSACGTGGESQWTLPAGPIFSQLPGKCLDDRGNSPAAGTAIQLSPCDGTAAQKWSLGPDASIRIHGKCLGTQNDRTTEGARAELQPCGNYKSQTWEVAPSQATFALWFWDGASDTGWCLSAPANSAAADAQLTLGNCFTSEPGDVWNIP
jgi:hypothetical protein